MVSPLFNAVWRFPTSHRRQYPGKIPFPMVRHSFLSGKPIAFLCTLKPAIE